MVDLKVEVIEGNNLDDFENPSKLEEQIMTNHDEKKLFECSECGKTYDVEKKLKRHVKEAHEGKKHLCTLCEKYYVTEKVLKEHVEMVHYKLKPLKCSECDHKFTRQSDLNKHLRIHEGKKFKCPHCDSIYSQKETLNKHIKSYHSHLSEISLNKSSEIYDSKIHLTEPFQCLNCPESFVSKYDLDNHVKYAHASDKLYNCSECIYSTNEKSNMTRHFRVRHKGITNPRFFL